MNVDPKLPYPVSASIDNFICSYNLRLTKKLLWMAGKLGSLNDTISITKWATSMSLIMNLLMKSSSVQIHMQPFKAKPCGTLTRSTPRCISNSAPPAPAMSIISVASSNLLPLPSPTSTCKADQEQNPDVSPNMNANHVNVAPKIQSLSLRQPTTPASHFQNCGIIKWGNNWKYPTQQICSSCNSNLWFLCTKDDLLRCHYCKLNPKVPSGEAVFWDCSNCAYLSCQRCLNTRQKKRKKR